jgi:hypothetical protein
MARAMTSAARTIEQPASSIMSSLAHGLIADMSVGLIAVAVQKARDQVRRPDHAAGGEQAAGLSGEELVVGQDRLRSAGSRAGLCSEVIFDDEQRPCGELTRKG